MVDTTLAGLVVDIKVLQVVVKVDTSSTEVSSKKSCVGGEDSSHVNLALAAERNSKTSLPFVEMSNDGSVEASGCKLSSAEFFKRSSYLSEEPSSDIAKDNGLVRLMVIGRGRNSSHVPEIGLPFIHPGNCQLRLISSPSTLTCHNSLSCQREALEGHPE